MRKYIFDEEMESLVEVVGDSRETEVPMIESCRLSERIWPMACEKKNRKPGLADMVEEYDRQVEAKVAGLGRQLDQCRQENREAHKEIESLKELYKTYNKRCGDAERQAAQALKRCRELEKQIGKLEQECETLREGLSALSGRCTALTRENDSLRAFISHLRGECAEYMKDAAPMQVVQNNFYPGSMHISGSHLPDACFDYRL